MEPSGRITALLAELQGGNGDAVDALAVLLYDELRRIASTYLSREREGHTLQPTALVNEAYLKLVDQRDVTWQNRAHFLGVAAQVMRRSLVDHARKRLRDKRGGRAARVTFDDERVGADERAVDLVALDDALVGLAATDAELARVVELRYFGGLTVEETAEALGSSPRSIDRAWATARAWLRREMRAAEPT
jgi:RNA polymerase sigma factor (TIGR02999 family)